MKIKTFIHDHKLSLSFALFLFCFSLFLMLFLRIDIDYFWHFKAGEYMVQNFAILTKDIFSWSLYHYSWILEFISLFLDFSWMVIWSYFIWIVSSFWKISFVCLYIFSNFVLSFFLVFYFEERVFKKHSIFFILDYLFCYGFYKLVW